MRQRPVSLELAMFGSVVLPETLQLGNGYQGLGWRESRDREKILTFKKRKTRVVLMAGL